MAPATPPSATQSSTTLRIPQTTAVGAAVAGAIGLVVSWAWFLRWGMEHGLDFWGFWSDALASGHAATGLSWDLAASAVIVTLLALAQHKRLGPGGLAVVLGGTWVLGVCVGLGALLWLRRER